MDKYAEKGKDFRIINTGEAGDGKSSLSLKFGEVKNPDRFIENPAYGVDNQVHYTAPAWMNAITILPPNSVNVHDEPGQSGANHREFMSDANMIVTKTLIGFRYKKFRTVLNIPVIDMLDLDAQKLCQVYIRLYDQGKAEAFRIKIPKFGGPPYFKKLVDRLTWGPVNDKLWTLYEAKKFRVQDELYKAYSSKLKKKEHSERSNAELLAEINGQFDELKGRNGRLSIPMIMGKLDIGRNRAEGLRAAIELDEQDAKTT